MEHNKKFLIIGTKNAITYKDFFPLLRDNRVWIGCNNVHEFLRPDGSIQKFGNVGWYTNLELPKTHTELRIWQHYYDENGNPMPDSETRYPHYDNYDAINVDRVQDIPCDYFGVMGVPISFMDKYCPDQFEIVAFRKGENGEELVFTRERERERV